MRTNPLFAKFAGAIGMAVFLNGCQKKEAEPECSRLGYVIGFDPCTGGYSSNKGGGLVIAFANSPDTVVTYNLPDTLYDFPPALFGGYQFFFLFPPAEQRKYKVRLSYRHASEQEKTFISCRGDINLADFNHYVRDRQIIIQCARKAE